MSFITTLLLRLLITAIFAAAITPLVRLLAFKIGAVDIPNKRRINKKIMPSAGGLAIYIAFSLSLVVLFQDIIPLFYSLNIIASSGIIVITGLLDDVIELTPRQKLFGMILAAVYVCFVFDITIQTVTLPYFGTITLGILSYPVTILWIIALTNAINLIDGLDGLASGISIIALTSIGFVGYIGSSTGAVKLQVPITIFILLFSIIGFFPFNFFPAKIFLGDTGALFLGFMISVLSIQGLKNATFISLITPLVILGVPITDTIFAMLRRKLNNRPISSADKMHLHHRLLSLGFTHRGAVIMIYCLAIVFSLIALLYMYTNTWATILLIISCAFGIELLIELLGLLGTDRQPMLTLFKFIGNRAYRQKKMANYHEKKNDKSE
ncbi:undecaprenyl-phosphate alpha-N-acetylglucosaminyl 1-phosphate transferase [Vagococcus penaei]|uniref:Undecaprenyl-phosphate alpha-N-acetylglucosaminyl 1-phosphate transferase n=1 Tax=Vagococcus penaei TaxID=633807 RepID=A0A1Q2D420_9ENTE|nr:MraY family glycosyltransferase [Vagococcus penaei]AQP53112.1 undecaprenyl-phosphate alpha-N-acetylglucosaminyl 1-phosphate transferase [Vagococcus penaei]RSU06026.1 undecaprenyl-phosphate alpha-N-acetylglucosaminyl 1-phosphate transferase [Vagococcus penaei]